ncbi:MAG: hypothetical protein [Bacteriophage sp.]|jgi:hypothetical protein|nr:MAG: hypothetical protein [Bacteriophage sp.]
MEVFIMKYCTKLRKEQSDFEQWLPLVGSYCGNAKIEKILEIANSDQYVICYTGTLKDFLAERHFFGKSNVFRCDW